MSHEVNNLGTVVNTVWHNWNGTAVGNLTKLADAIATSLHNLYNDADQTAAYWMNQAGMAGTDIGQAIASVYQDSDKALAARQRGRHRCRRHRHFLAQPL